MLTDKQVAMLNDEDCVLTFPLILCIDGHVTVSTLVASCESQDILAESIIDAYVSSADVLHNSDYSILCSLYKPGEKVETIELSDVLALRNI